MKIKAMTLAAGSLLLCACTGNDKKQAAESDWVDAAIENAHAQIAMEIDSLEAKGDTIFRIPTTIDENGNVVDHSYRDWRSGFFPGSVWYTYELSGDTALLPYALKYTEAISEAQNITDHHDIGFIIMSSYGNALRLTGDSAAYVPVIKQAANSLITRFRQAPGVIQSWDINDWNRKKGWECPVIIDNMMNLNLLFKATELTGDSTYYNLAVQHADRTLKEHFRPDGSCYHVIDYSLSDGTVQHRNTAQGYADESAWARGQAWAVYGFAETYRNTGDKRYLDQAIKTFNFLKNHPNMPEDGVMYWDMDAPEIPDAPRDASSAAVLACGLYEMSTFDTPEAASYKEFADKIMHALSTDAYTAPVGENGRFILMHSVGNKPGNKEVDVPLNYADYYYLEGIARKKAIEDKTK